jgi:uncharacterized protein
MTMVFLDTVGLLALWDRSDQWHDRAEQAFAQLAAARRPCVTTTGVMLECGNASARYPYRLAVDRLRQQLEDDDLLIEPTAADWRQGWAAYREGQADGAGIVDQISFCVMRRLRITHAFTNDHHFRAAGFEPLFR